MADQFDLPDSVTEKLRDSDDAVELVGAILEAGGHVLRVDHELLVCGEDAIVVLADHKSHAAPHDALNRAYLRFRESGCPRGTVIAAGYSDYADIHRRELLAPELRHVGQDAIQRMADAVSVGADPLLFLTAPALRA